MHGTISVVLLLNIAIVKQTRIMMIIPAGSVGFYLNAQSSYVFFRVSMAMISLN